MTLFLITTSHVYTIAIYFNGTLNWENYTYVSILFNGAVTIVLVTAQLEFIILMSFHFGNVEVEYCEVASNHIIVLYYPVGEQPIRTPTSVIINTSLQWKWKMPRLFKTT